MIRKIAAVVLGISCAGLFINAALERFAPGFSETVVEAETAAEVDAATEQSGASELYGTYTFEESGTVLGKVPWRANIELELKRNGRYEVRIETAADGDTDVDWKGGEYRIEGDKLVLFDEDGERSDFDKLRIEGDRIRLDADWPAILALKVVGVGEAALQKKVDAAEATAR